MPFDRESLDGDLAELAERARAGLVQVRTGREGSGAGTIWHPAGLILTNAHVASRRRLEIVLADGRTLPAQVEALDEHLDLAALTVSSDRLPAMDIGASRELRAGEIVMAVGHPWGVMVAATVGVVIGAGADLPDMPGAGRELLAVSLHLRPGHSGGALVDSRGRLVGINTMMAGPDVGLAIPVDVVKSFMKGAVRGAYGPQAWAA
jgi:serine protease Do